MHTYYIDIYLKKKQRIDKNKSISTHVEINIFAE